MDSQKKIKPREITCASCGAHYGAEQLRCPYCNSVNDLADEREFMEDLGEIRRNMEKLPSESRKEETRAAIRDVRKVIRGTVAIVLSLVFVIAALTFVNRLIEARQEAKREEERAEEYAWKLENFARLDALYEQEDYDGLLALSGELMDGPLYEWEHYDLLLGLSDIEQAREDIAYLEELLSQEDFPEDRIKDNTAWVLRDELMVYFFDLRCKNEKDCRIIRERAADIFEDLETRFALTEEEWAFLNKKAEEEYGYINYQACSEFLENRQESGRQ